jgi:hypothetical protein
MELCGTIIDFIVEANELLSIECMNLTTTFQAKYYYVRSRSISNSISNVNNNGRKYDPSTLVTLHGRTKG